MSSSGPGARTGGDREHSRSGPASKARLPHVYGVLYVLLVSRICAFSDGCAAADTTFDRALVHMYLIKVVAIYNVSHIRCHLRREISEE